jgi:hypothetical protein
MCHPSLEISHALCFQLLPVQGDFTIELTAKAAPIGSDRDPLDRFSDAW